MVGLASADRVSIYSSGVLSGTGERGSLYTTKQGSGAGDGASIRSAAYSHGRNESNAASISGVTSASINQPIATGRISRRSSGWGEINEDKIAGGESDEEKGVEKRVSDDDKIDTKTQIST